jgi:hypothetical protein
VNLTPTSTVREITVWAAYAIGVMILFFRPVRTPARPQQSTAAQQG